MTDCPLTNSTFTPTWIENTFKLADATCAMFTVISASFLLYATSFGFLHPPSLTVASRILFWSVTTVEAIIISNVQAGFIRILICLTTDCDLHSSDPGSAAGIASITFIVLWPTIFVILMTLQVVGIQSMSLFVDIDSERGMFKALARPRK